MNRPKVILKDCNMHEILAESIQRDFTHQGRLILVLKTIFPIPIPSAVLHHLLPVVSDIHTNKMSPNSMPGGNIPANNTSEKPVVFSALSLPVYGDGGRLVSVTNATPQSLITH